MLGPRWWADPLHSLPPGLPGTWAQGSPRPPCTGTRKPSSSPSEQGWRTGESLSRAGRQCKACPRRCTLVSVCAVQGEPCRPPSLHSRRSPRPCLPPAPRLACAPGELLNARPSPSASIQVTACHPEPSGACLSAQQPLKETAQVLFFALSRLGNGIRITVPLACLLSVGLMLTLYCSQEVGSIITPRCHVQRGDKAQRGASLSGVVDRR